MANNIHRAFILGAAIVAASCERPQTINHNDDVILPAFPAIGDSPEPPAGDDHVEAVPPTDSPVWAALYKQGCPEGGYEQEVGRARRVLDLAHDPETHDHAMRANLWLANAKKAVFLGEVYNPNDETPQVDIALACAYAAAAGGLQAVHIEPAEIKDTWRAANIAEVRDSFARAKILVAANIDIERELLLIRNGSFISFDERERIEFRQAAKVSVQDYDNLEHANYKNWTNRLLTQIETQPGNQRGKEQALSLLCWAQNKDSGQYAALPESGADGVPVLDEGTKSAISKRIEGLGLATRWQQLIKNPKCGLE
ncbi:MAG: hypothetical protein WDO70_00795 [Alphaproteobacteria bacterium]